MFSFGREAVVSVKFKRSSDWVEKKKTVILVKRNGKGKFKICFTEFHKKHSDVWQNGISL